MPTRTNTTILSAFAILATLSCARAADTLADMDIEVSPELQAMGIDPGVKHMAINGRWQAVNSAGAVLMLALVGQAAADPIFALEARLAGIPGAGDRGGPIVIIGDSIMAALGSSPGVVNLAFPGATTSQILGQIDHLPPGAREVIIEGGINDGIAASGTPARIFNDYATMLQKIPAGVSVKVIGILPVNSAQSGGVSNTIISGIDAQINRLCVGRCSVIPSPFGNSLPAALSSGDGVHPNAAGNTVLRSVIH